jgi:hypothetical protein
MREYGLLKFWKRRFMSSTDLNVRRCQSIIQSKKTEPEKQSERKALSLESLSGAFILLLVGYIVTIIAFLFEKIMRSFNKNKIETGIVSEQIMLAAVYVKENKAKKAPEPQNEVNKVGKTAVMSNSEKPTATNDAVSENKDSQSNIVVEINVHTEKGYKLKAEQKQVEEEIDAVIKTLTPPKTFYTKESQNKIQVFDSKVYEKEVEEKQIIKAETVETVTAAHSKPFYTKDSPLDEIISLDDA